MAELNLAAYIDHTNLKQNARKEDLARLCDEAAEFGFATVSINSCWTKFAAARLAGTSVGVTSCIGFPLGACTTSAKVAEVVQAVKDGTTEIDMVMNVGKLLDGEDAYVREDIARVVEAADGRPVKVILECCLLDDEQITRACKLCVEAGAAFVKTSTGFSTGGATVHDVQVMRAAVGDACKIKAAGGIHTKEDALALIEAGADRLGCSASIAIVQG